MRKCRAPGFVTACAVLLAWVLGGVAAAPAAGARTIWLCRPGVTPSPCTPGLSTTIYTPSLKWLGVRHPRRVRHPAVDCFYVYPTVSDQQTRHAPLRIDPEERSIAAWQIARYSQFCRVFAPMYRQVTVPYLLRTGHETWSDLALPFSDVQRAFRDYLAHYNLRRGFILIGHSQGAALLRELIRRDIDDNPVLRRRLVSAIVLGGNVLVKRGSDIGGDFTHVPACRRASQIGCVIAFSTFDQPAPANAIYGRVDGMFQRVGPSAGDEVLCTNPAALGGGSGLIDPIMPSKPFAPGTLIAGAIKALGVALPMPKTVWVEAPGSFRASCTTGSTRVLEIVPQPGATAPHPTPVPAVGVHLTDANIALGNLIGIVRAQVAAYLRRTGTRR